MPYRAATARLRSLLRRPERVLTVMHTPSAGLARSMEAAGAEAAFVGTSGVVGAYTGMEDVGVRGGDKGWSILFVNFRGDNVTLASAMRARGWTVSDVNGTLRVVPALQIPSPPSGQ